MDIFLQHMSVGVICDIRPCMVWRQRSGRVAVAKIITKKSKDGQG